ncbi:MAG: HEPN domain-containing protein [Acetobacter sp.]|nr:HEPN domain-containing protein [Bacteroides sp.]MCM1340759.1 HEPN domain-containing protein [Acetobacter sp.]MCM1432684.1 HEPN domain-containing protein [Clostridiales bacterium]
MPDQELKELSELQFNRAKELINFIPGYIELGDYNSVVNRSYYAAFHAMKAVELLAGFDSKKHSGVIAYFRKNYIKTGLFDSALSDMIGDLQEAREDSDYDMVIQYDLDSAKEYYQMAKEIVNAIENYLDEKTN